MIDSSDLDKKVETLATKPELKANQDSIVKLQAFDSSYFCWKSHFEDDWTSKHWMFNPVFKYIFFKKNAYIDPISVLFSF